MHWLKNLFNQFVLRLNPPRGDDPAFSTSKDHEYAASEIIEQSRVSKKRSRRNSFKPAGKASRSNRVQRKAKGRSKKG